MKSERRHELQHNDLAEWALKSYESLSPYRNAIIGIALLVVVAVAAWSIWRSHSAAQAAEAWNAVETPESIYFPFYTVPQYADEMEKDSHNYVDTSAGDWARVLTADSCLFLAESEVMTNKQQAQQHFDLALERYEKTLSSSNFLARQRALFGKARILESTGKLAEATAAYQELNKSFPKGTFAAIADQRLEKLAKPDTAEFYKAVAQYTPKPAKESPANKLESIGPLPENPEEPALTPPAKPASSGSGAAASGTRASNTGASGTGASAPKTSATAEPALPMPESSKTTAAAPAAPLPEAPKSTAAAPALPTPEAAKPTSTAPDATKTASPK